jgi:predicted TIM-barrel fold metal-dependent hydrolase
MSCFTLFDAHVHVGRWLTPDFAGRETDLADAGRVLDSAGVTGALVMPTDLADNEGLLAAIDHHSGLPDLLFAAWIDPANPGTMAFLTENSRRISALKIHTSFVRLPVTDPAFAPYLGFAFLMGLPVVVHCGRWREVAGYEHVCDAAERHPGVTFVLSHMGGDSPPLVLGAASVIRERGLANCILGTESIREYWLVRAAIDIVGPRAVMFGSDHNLNHPASFIAVVRAACANAEDEALVLGGNAERVFGNV